VIKNGLGKIKKAFFIIFILWLFFSTDPTQEKECPPIALTIAKQDGNQECYCLPCNQDYQQVCGDDGVTYGNECEMKYTACDMDKQIVARKQGPCGKKAASHNKVNLVVLRVLQ